MTETVDKRRVAPGGGPPARRMPVLAWSVCAVAVGTMLGGVAFEVVRGEIAPAAENVLEQVLLFVGFAALPVIGALVASRHPGNAVGWLFLTVGAGIGVLALSSGYAHWAVHERQLHLPAVTLAALFGNWLWIPSIGLLFTLVFLLFPNGRPPSPRWRWLVWASGITVALLAIGGMVQDRLDMHGTTLDNPLGLGLYDDAEAALEPLFLPLGGLCVLCAASLVVRFRRARGDERQQLKWVAYSGTFMLIAFFVEVPGSLAVGLFAVDASLAVSMLKYRLYDIDRVINKTLVYGVLTALLVAGYAGGVLLIQTVLPLPDNSPAAVAGSTLAMAALFGPLHRGVQKAVDRRFYRSRYDAIRIIEGFETSLRRRTDLEGLTEELVAVARQTVHPNHVSLWLVDTGDKTK